MKLNTFIFGLLMILSAAFAACSISAISGPASATVGASATITVTVGGTECTGADLQLVDMTAGLSVTDPPSSQSYKYSNVESGDVKSFTVTASSAGTYSYNAQVSSATGTAQSIQFVSGSQFIVSRPAPSSSSQSGSSSFTYSVTIQNSGDGSAIATYEVSASGSTASGAATTGSQTIGAGSSLSLSWTVTPSRTGSVGFNLNGLSTSGTAVTVTVATPPSPSGGSVTPTPVETNATTTPTTPSTPTIPSTTTPATTPSTTPSTTPPSTTPTTAPTGVTVLPTVGSGPSGNAAQIYSVISSARSQTNDLRSQGVSVPSSVDAKINDALRAYNSGDYQTAQTLAQEAYDAVQQLRRSAPSQPTVGTQTTKSGAGTGGISPLVLIGGIVVGLVVILGAAYFLIMKKK